MIDDASLDHLRHRLRDHADALGIALLGEPTSRTNRELRWGRKGSLSMRLDGERRGKWMEHGVEGGGPIKLIKRERQVDFPGAVRWALAWLGDPGREAPPPRRAANDQPAVEHVTLSPWGRELWAAARPVTAGCVAGRYLLGRRCALPEPHAVRWLPCLRYGPTGAEFPALLGLITDIHDAGRPLNLHRTWLAPDGSGKAPVDRPRLLLRGHRKAGGVIRLSPDDEVTHGVGIGEGIETCLTVLSAGWGPIWCCVDAGNVKGFPVLDGIDAVTVFGDYDRVDPKTGKRPCVEAAHACADRWATAGREARVLFPPTEGTDFNDWGRAVA